MALRLSKKAVWMNNLSRHPLNRFAVTRTIHNFSHSSTNNFRIISYQAISLCRFKAYRFATKPAPTGSHSEESSFDVPPATYPTASTAPTSEDVKYLKTIASDSIAELNSILRHGDFSALSSLMLSHGCKCYWRDHLGLTDTKFLTLAGIEDIATFLKTNKCSIRRIALDNKQKLEVGSVDPMGKIKSIRAFITFENTIGRGRGVITWVRDTYENDGWRIFTIFTSLDGLKNFPWVTGETRPLFAVPEDVDSKMTWKEYRKRKHNFENEDPAVLIVGAGHSGLMTAAHLTMLGVSTLVIDMNERTGDSWRKRYNSLVLHDTCWMNSMPYLAFPQNRPASGTVYASKDKLADFLEFYASTLELNIWNSTKVVETTWIKGKARWRLVFDSTRNGMKEIRTLYPRHLVQSTGLNGEPSVPDITGKESFTGTLIHSSDYSGATSDWSGKKVIIVGASVSGHDIARDAYLHGADVMMIQRSSTWVVSLEAIRNASKIRYDEGENIEDADLLMEATPTALVKRNDYGTSHISRDFDKPLLDALKKVGFKMPPVDDRPTGLYLTIYRGGGFYVDTGTSSLIASGNIKLKQGQAISSVSQNSVTFTDGSTLPADIIIFATRYANGRTRTRQIFGDAVAEEIDPIWGFDKMGEIRGVWRRSGHEGFWVAAGTLRISRYYSRLLALQIKAVEEGLVSL